jgi:hypothetical protein
LKTALNRAPGANTICDRWLAELAELPADPADERPDTGPFRAGGDLLASAQVPAPKNLARGVDSAGSEGVVVVALRA